MNESSTIFDVVILGSGPSGLTAALYTSRAFLKTLVLGGNPPGGQLTITTQVENFPGFPDGVLGTELISKIRKQVENNEAMIVDQNVVKISGSFEENFTIETEEKNVFKSRTIIIATGSSAKWLGLESERKFIGRGVSACATCDGFFYKDKVVAVVGGGDSAMEESTFLTRFADKVYVIVRKGKNDLRASKYMQKKAFDNPKIEFIYNSVVKEVLGNDVVTGIKIATKNQKDGVEVEEESTLNLDGLFLAIGHEPNTKFLEGFIDLDEKGYIKMFENHQTSKEGVFVSGDVHDHTYRQAISAAGYGCQAAIDVTRFLSDHGFEVHVSSYE